MRLRIPTPSIWSTQKMFTGKIVGGGSKFFYIDNSENTTEEQQKAAEAFLNWLAGSDEGKTLISDTCAMVSPFKSNDVPCANHVYKSRNERSSFFAAGFFYDESGISEYKNSTPAEPGNWPAGMLYFFCHPADDTQWQK